MLALGDTGYVDVPWPWYVAASKTVTTALAEPVAVLTSSGSCVGALTANDVSAVLDAALSVTTVWALSVAVTEDDPRAGLSGISVSVAEPSTVRASVALATPLPEPEGIIVGAVAPSVAVLVEDATVNETVVVALSAPVDELAAEDAPSAIVVVAQAPSVEDEAALAAPSGIAVGAVAVSVGLAVADEAARGTRVGAATASVALATADEAPSATATGTAGWAVALAVADAAPSGTCVVADAASVGAAAADEDASGTCVGAVSASVGEAVAEAVPRLIERTDNSANADSRLPSAVPAGSVIANAPVAPAAA